MKKLLCLVLLITGVFSEDIPEENVPTENVFHMKDGHYSRYLVDIDAQSYEKVLKHTMEFWLKKGDGDDIVLKMKNVKLDPDFQQGFDHVDVLEMTRNDWIFEFEDNGAISFKKPEDFEQPYIYSHDEKLINAIKKGKREFSKRILVPFTDKKCKSNVTVTEEEDVFIAKLDVEEKCLNHPLVETKIDLTKVFFKDTFELKSYTISNIMTVEDVRDKQKKEAVMIASFVFDDFVPLKEKDEL